VSAAAVMAQKLRPENHLPLIEIGGNDLLMGTSADQFKVGLDALLSKVTTLGPQGDRRRIVENYGVSPILKRFLAEV